MILKKYKKFSDETLTGYICKGNVAAFNEIYKRYSNRLFMFFLRMLRGDEEKAKDFLQDIFVTVIEKSHYFDCNKIFSNWIFTIAKNMCMNEYKSIKYKKNCQNTLELNQNNQYKFYPGIDEQIDKKEFMKSLFIELDKLDQKSNTVFLLRYQENFKIQQISEILSMSQGTVKSRLHYTSKKIAVKLKKLNPNI